MAARRAKPNRPPRSTLPAQSAASIEADAAETLPGRKGGELHVARIETRHELSFFPTPERLRGYEDILPGSAERVFSVVEQEQKQKHKHIRHYQSNETLRIVAALVISLAIIVTGFFIIWFGHPLWGAFALILGAVPAIIKPFLDRKK